MLQKKIFPLFPNLSSHLRGGGNKNKKKDGHSELLASFVSIIKCSVVVTRMRTTTRMAFKTAMLAVKKKASSSLMRRGGGEKEVKKKKKKY